METPEQRRQNSYDKRVEAAKLAFDKNHPAKIHTTNGDESLPRHLMSFTKGLPHDFETGLLIGGMAGDDAFNAFVKGINSGDPEDFKKTPLGIKNPDGTLKWHSKKAVNNKVNARAWESAGAGLCYDLEGPDAQAVGMPPAPALGSDELTGEIAEIYAQALLRDIPFVVFYDKAFSRKKDRDYADKIVKILNKIKWFKQGNRNGEKLTLNTAFRGLTKGDLAGPYLSQFLLTGNTGLDNKNDDTKEFDASEGLINFGSITISQKVREAQENVNYLTIWDEWFDAQNGANFGRLEEYRGNARRFITTGRDLSTYVHYDALYEAYLNACLLLLSAESTGAKPKYDPGVPFQNPDFSVGAMGVDTGDHQQGFAHYGGPHILTLVTEVATRALKAVRFQKFNTHRRLRPEALAARFEKFNKIVQAIGNQNLENNLRRTYQELDQSGIFDLLRSKNGKNLLLPMAFAEGSPMHPSYGAGHATVAGACVTIMKAFFNHEKFVNISKDGDNFTISDEPGKYAFVPNINGRRLVTVDTEPLTVEGELNKLAANISIGRDWAGVHYYSDYAESLKLGEEVAIKLLEEQALTYNHLEHFSLTVPKFDGTVVTISNQLISV